MKKLLSVLLSLTLALSLASCGGTDSASSAAPSESGQAQSQEAQGEPSGAAAADLPGSADILLVCEEAAQGAGGVSGDVKPAQTAESAE